jgi:hypothetical protein
MLSSLLIGKFTITSTLKKSKPTIKHPCNMMSGSPFINKIKSIRTNGILYRSLLSKQRIDLDNKSIEIIENDLESAIISAKEVCLTGSNKDCMIAWEKVEELSSIIADKKYKKQIQDEDINNLDLSSDSKNIIFDI